MLSSRTLGLVVAISSISLAGQLCAAEKKYGPGASDTEIKLGQTVPYSGPASAFSSYGRTMAGYFQMVNEAGGINGRKINLISLDNAYNPPKALEQTRKLVEEDNVLAIAGFLGTAPNTSVQKYLNGKKVPNLFLTSGADRFNDPKTYPWIVPLYPTYVGQGEIYAKFILTKHPAAKIGVLYINDDLGKDFLLGLKKGLGDRAKTMIVREVSNELTDPSVDSQIIDLIFVGNLDKNYLLELIEKAEKLISRKIRYLVFTESEFVDSNWLIHQKNPLLLWSSKHV